MRGLLQVPRIQLKSTAMASVSCSESRPTKRWEATEPNECQKKSDTDWRILAINVNNFPSEKNGFEKAKIDLLKATLILSDADVMGLSEVGRNEYKMDFERTPSNIAKQWFENGIAHTAWNKDSISVYEPGGSMMITRDKSTAHTIKRGSDARDLGRWTWTTVKGKQNVTTTFISAYRPTNTQVTAQNQLNVIRKFHGSIQPEELWEKDLGTLIRDKQKLGSVIVMGDFNDDLNDSNGKVHKFFSSLGMHEALNNRYSKGPPTYAFGSKKIDGIYVSNEIVVRQGGYGGHTGPPSDHLIPWIDIEEKYIVGTARDDRPPPVLRRATSKIPSVKHSFNEHFNAQIERYALASKVDDLFESAKKQGGLTHVQEAMYDKIEERIRRAIKCADKRCRKVRRGKVPYSKKQKELMGKLFVLRAIYLRAKLVGKKRRPHWRYISRLIKKYAYNGQTRFDSLEKIKEEICAAAAEYNAFRPKAHEYKLSHRSQLAHAIAADTGKDPEIIYKNLTNQDETKNHFKRIRALEKRGNKSGVDKIDVETPDGIKTVFNKEEIEDAIIDANKKKLLQAEDTPLRTEPLRSLVGERMDYETWEQLLHKNIQIPNDLEEGTRLWFDAIQNFEDNPIDLEWDTLEYFQAWDKMTEDKSALPGVQAAHIKSIDRHSEGADVVSKMALIPLITGYAPTAWKKGIDSMIPKKKNEWRPDKLRIILLMEARFNQNNKLIGRKMMEHGERSGFLAREQFGSRPAKSAIVHALNKRLTIDIARQSKTPAIYIANDAKACYDRILPMVSYVTMRHMGITELAARSSINTLIHMPRNIKTVYGESSNCYATDLTKDEILHGIGQGNGYGPIIWAGISSPLLKILRSQGFGVDITSPITGENIQMAGYSYVDDTDQIELQSDETNWNTVLENSQKSITAWECLLRTTGGALEPSKTDWVKVLYEYIGGKLRLQKANQDDIITLRDPNGQIVPIKQIESHTARRTLGVWQAANGQEHTQRDILLNKIKEWGGNTVGISNKEATTASVSTIGRSIRFPLTATALTSSQCGEVDRAWKRHTLNKMGIAKTAPKEVAFSPVDIGGMGLHHTEIDQTIDHIKMIIAHGNMDTVTGKLLRNTIQQLTIETGLQGEPLNHNLENITYLTENTWIENTIRCCRRYKVTFDTDLPQLEKWIDNDDFIMERALRVIKGSEIRTFNNVRLYLQVATTSDITTADGKRIDPDILRGNRGFSPSPSTHKYKWPHVPEPSQKDKEKWTSVLCRLYHISILRPQLGGTHYGWYTYKAIEYASWVIQITTNIIYQRWNNLWIGWILLSEAEKTEKCKNKITYKRTNNMIDNLPNAVAMRPITVNPEDNNIISVRCRGRFQPRLDEDTLFTPWYTPSENPMTEEDETYFINNIINNEGLLVGDGSYKDGRSSAAVVFQHKKTETPKKDATNYISTTVPGPRKDQSSYRGELGSILSGIATTNLILNKYNITKGSCTFACDNKGALAAAFGWKTPTPDWTCFDLLSLIRQQLAQSPIKWTMQHVKGHQDNKKKYKELSIEAQANVHADLLAKQELALSNDDQLYWGQYGQPWGLTCYNFRICGNVEESLRFLMQSKEAMVWWKKRLKIPTESVHTVSNEVYIDYRTKTKKELRTWSIKFSADLLPTRKNLLRRKHSTEHTCPCCGAANEDADHLFQCRSKEMRKTFEENIDEITSYLHSTTSTKIKNSIVELLHCLRNNRRPKRDNNSTHVDIIIAQQTLGLRATLNGFWDKQWLQEHKDYLTITRSRCSPVKWLTTLSLHIQQMLYSLWKRRNELLHNYENAVGTKNENDQINNKIKELFETVPNLRLLPPCDAAYFGRGSKRILDYRLARKRKWLDDATRILDSFRRSLDASSETFLDYFTNT